MTFFKGHVLRILHLCLLKFVQHLNSERSTHTTFLYMNLIRLNPCTYTEITQLKNHFYTMNHYLLLVI